MSLTVNLNGKELIFEKSHIKNISELVNLIQLGVAPHAGIISDISVQGQDLSATEWSQPLSSFGDTTIEISTTTKDAFIQNRLTLAKSYIDVVIAKFNIVPPTYKEQDSARAAACLTTATKDLNYFCDWFFTIVQVDTQRFGGVQDKVKKHLDNLSGISEGLINKQMSNKWDEVTTAIEKELIPQLEELSREVEGI